VLDLFGADLGERLRTAALLALTLGYGLVLSKISVQTYINRRLPVAYQSRAFARQNPLKHGLAIVPCGASAVPRRLSASRECSSSRLFALLGLAAVLVYLSYRFAGEELSGTLDVLSTFWQEGTTSRSCRRPRAEPQGRWVEPIRGRGARRSR